MMKLLKFRVRNFRSVEDSGWIDTGNLTALIGTNEAGKTNLLLPLWKLNPATVEEIDPIADYPRKHYNEIRTMKNKPVFIEAYFELSNDLIDQVVKVTGAAPDEVRIVWVQRDLGGAHRYGFPNAAPLRRIPKFEFITLLSQAQADFNAKQVLEAEESLKFTLSSRLESARALSSAAGQIDKNILDAVYESLTRADILDTLMRSSLASRVDQLLNSLAEMRDRITKRHPQESPEARAIIKENMPFFVYYSSYGNLDSEIYLPHVIQNLQRDDLGDREEAKARTLRVLFEFVKLSPQEILELGRNLPYDTEQPSPDQLEVIAARKMEREILLQSASVDLTRKFREWWKQGEYRLRFQADGDHFRIWVSDEKRPEEIELEGRSTGLQWFLSFYLVCLVESNNAHEGAILLLDEPGLSLHPLAQRDLLAFFNILTATNQILYTTHSPFMVDSDHLDRVRAVYVDQSGATAVSADLRAGEIRSAQSKSIFPVVAALGLSVSDTLLQGCQPVIVEKTSDQVYLNAIKNYLISKGRLTPQRELVFIPAGNSLGISAVVSILNSKDETLPFIILRSDAWGRQLRQTLCSDLYRGHEDRILMAGDFAKVKEAWIEDLFPPSFLAGVISRTLRGPEEDFDEIVREDEPIVAQIELFADRYEIGLKRPGWELELAVQIKTRLLKSADPVKKYEDVIEQWRSLFMKLIA